MQEALGQLVGAAKEGLVALSVIVGLGVLSKLLEEEVCELGPRGSGTLSRSTGYASGADRRAALAFAQ